MRSRTRALIVLAAAAAVAAVIAVVVIGFGDSSKPPPPPAAASKGTPVTSAQALVLAKLLAQNHDRGGARFSADFMVEGQPATATGSVDFRSGKGTAVVAPKVSSQGPARRYYWTRHTVLAQSAPSSKRYTTQAPDPQNDPIHTLIGFVNLLSAETIDNTTTIQSQGARFIRRDAIAGTPVDVYRYGPSGDTTFWVGPDGLLARAGTNRVSGTLTVTLLSHAPVSIHLPASGDSATP